MVKRIPDQVWENHRGKLYQLYMVDRKPLHKVMDEMMRTYGFETTKRQMHFKFEKWNWKKYNLKINPNSSQSLSSNFEKPEMTKIPKSDLVAEEDSTHLYQFSEEENAKSVMADFLLAVCDDKAAFSLNSALMRRLDRHSPEWHRRAKSLVRSADTVEEVKETLLLLEETFTEHRGASISPDACQHCPTLYGSSLFIEENSSQAILTGSKDM